MTMSTEWGKSPFEDLGHGRQGTTIDWWWCQDPYCKEVNFSLLDVGVGGWVAGLIPFEDLRLQWNDFLCGETKE